ncbi:hypothetical protein AWR36_006110 [Microbulbifer flavimaris]|uniref:Secreted protein n=1 Tax=Microbulbifer flavimaris TaxID=1781068 RepID=A0ABX4I0K6_9GAMM|nr:hypothetical protein AVO43_06095 [Microbulbifer sp. ZGT114]PCO05588.1 hypothetical protein AWR36_006110 [Microbulbifer flavimaris]
MCASTLLVNFDALLYLRFVSAANSARGHVEVDVSADSVLLFPRSHGRQRRPVLAGAAMHRSCKLANWDGFHRGGYLAGHDTAGANAAAKTA